MADINYTALIDSLDTLDTTHADASLNEDEFDEDEHHLATLLAATWPLADYPHQVSLPLACWLLDSEEFLDTFMDICNIEEVGDDPTWLCAGAPSDEEECFDIAQVTVPFQGGVKAMCDKHATGFYGVKVIGDPVSEQDWRTTEPYLPVVDTGNVWGTDASNGGWWGYSDTDVSEWGDELCGDPHCPCAAPTPDAAVIPAFTTEGRSSWIAAPLGLWPLASPFSADDIVSAFLDARRFLDDLVRAA